MQQRRWRALTTLRPAPHMGQRANFGDLGLLDVMSVSTTAINEAASDREHPGLELAVTNAPCEGVLAVDLHEELAATPTRDEGLCATSHIAEEARALKSPTDLSSFESLVHAPMALSIKAGLLMWQSNWPCCIMMGARRLCCTTARGYGRRVC